MRFAGKGAFVTGAGHGIGRATALRLAEEGAEKPADKPRSRSAKSSKAQPSLLLPVRGGLADKPKAQPAEAPKRRKRAS